MSGGRSTYGLVLAAGEGARLRSLTTDRAGRAVPKQFCSLRGGRSLFGDALERARRVVEPELVVTVVAADQREHWSSEVGELDPENVVVQPKNRGTAAGILLPLLAIHERDPRARIVVLPSDHHGRDEAALVGALAEALDAVDDERVALRGIEPDAPETDYGWIVPGAPRSGWRKPRRVAEFVETPDALAARELMARGGLWNSFLLAGTVESFLELYAQHLPELLASFAAARLASPAHRPAWIEMLYVGIGAHDFSRDVLEAATPWLDVVEAPACGWTDLGTPERVARCLRAERALVEPSPGPAARLVLARALEDRGP
ncbi:MAG: NTP transferase domain-containing protein [Planctomycetes bacterium]|nr:NTP transferase domain-containing protein [Planctomycetota bacterium]